MPKDPDKPSPDVHRRATQQGMPRPPAPTLTDEVELEDARRRSLPSSPAPTESAATVPPRKSESALSLVNARAPSVPPPAEPRALDGDWDALDDPALEPDVPAPPKPERDDRQTAVTAPPGGPASGPPLVTVTIVEGVVTSPPPLAASEAVTVRPQTAATAPAAALPTAPPASPEQDLQDRLALGDYTGALAVAERLLAGDPRHPEALAAAESCRAVLRKMYAARIGPLDRVASVAIPREQMRWLSIDHRAGFVLSLVDGVSTVEMILDVSGMPELDALRILSELVQQRIITLR